MKQLHMFKYFISISFLFLVANGFSQEQKKDSTNFKAPYGLRVGIDISKPIFGMFEDDFSGFEFVADYRITKNLYIAAEIGNEEETTSEDYLKTASKGNYVKIGVNLNAYKNWLDMNNEIYVGFRYAFSNFEQTLKSYTPNTGSDYFPGNPTTIGTTTKHLTAHWLEFLTGLKVETFKNLFVGFSVSYKVILSVNHPKDFQTFYVPGFNRVFESETGFGFNYTISYTIPFFKR